GTCCARPMSSTRSASCSSVDCCCGRRWSEYSTRLRSSARSPSWSASSPRPANWGVARLLLAPSRNNAAIPLASIHDIGDVYVSLAPVAAGLLVSLTGYSIFDPLIAAGIAVWIIASTVREVFSLSEELIWPEKIVCGHSDHDEAAIGAAPSQP